MAIFSVNEKMKQGLFCVFACMAMYSSANAMNNCSVKENGLLLQNAEGDDVEFPLTSYMRGDVDLDGKLTVKDVVALLNYLKSGDSKGIYVKAADVDGKDDVKKADVDELVRLILNGESGQIVELKYDDVTLDAKKRNVK